MCAGQADTRATVAKGQLHKLHVDLRRYGKMPWQSKRYLRKLPWHAYIRSKGMFLMPVAHMMLHGMLQDLLIFVVITRHQDSQHVQFTED